MGNLTVHQKINFKSHYYPNDTDKSLFRINRPTLYGHYATKNGNEYSFNIPYWAEMQSSYYLTRGDKFNNKK